MSTADVEVVEKFLSSLIAGDIPGALAHASVDLRLVEAGSIPHAGTYEGHDGLGRLLTRINDLFGGFELGDASFHDAGEFVVSRMKATFISKTGDRRVSMAVAEHYWVREGKVAYVDVYYKEPGLLNDL